MNDLLDSMHMQVQDIANQLALLKQQFVSFSPSLDEDENLSSLVATLQTDVDSCKSHISTLQSNVSSLSNTYTQLVTNIETNTNDITALKAQDEEILLHVENMRVGCNSVQNLAINNLTKIEGVEAILDHHIDQTSTHSSAIETLQSKTSTLEDAIQNIEKGTTCDNELYFIVKGSYAAPDQIDQIINGTY